jgi:hypothetical protein
VTEGSWADPVPRPWVLDVSVLVAIARADAEVTNLVITLDGRGQPLIIPVLAVAAASGDTRTEDGDIALVAWKARKQPCRSPTEHRAGHKARGYRRLARSPPAARARAGGMRPPRS